MEWRGNRDRSAQCPRLLDQGLSLARWREKNLGCEKNLASVTFRVGPTRHVSPRPIDQIFKLFDVHRPTCPTLIAAQNQRWRIYVALWFRAEQK
jgi:hypothetical protein